MNKFPVCPIFIPANRLEWVDKTFDKGADAVIIDLEDSVPKDQKVETRTNLHSYLEPKDFDKTILIRVNPLDSTYGKDDMNLLSEVSS
ncbi:MAG: CoA ester lyase, partial [Euryarchaeota archaeon]|nr:CoA ester lyase [Euryarchaeota archaeon]